MGRERVAREAERTDPEFSSDVDLAMHQVKSILGAYMSDNVPVRVQDCSARRRLACDGLIKDGREVFSWL